MASEIVNAIGQTLGLVARIGISRTHPYLGQLPQAWQETKNALKYTYGDEKIIHINNLVLDQAMAHLYPVTVEKSVIETMLFVSNANAAELVATLSYSFIAASSGNREILFGFCLEFYM